MRIWATYSGGDPGLKENVKFKSPSNKEKKILLNTLDKCYNLEEAFKINREKWLRILFYLHPMTKVNEKLYPNVYKYSKLLRNSPKELKTFNGHIESGLANKDIDVLDLLATRMGVYTRRLDHTVRVFGVIAVSKWLAKKPTSKQLIDAYNHFYGRDKADTRTAILAGSGSSDMVSYKALKPLTTGVIDSIRENILVHLKNQLNGKLGKVYIDPLLYLRSFVSNNRAASISIGGTANGTIVSVDPITKVLRMYCMWEGSSDIDLSCWAFGDTMTPVKVGFAGTDNWKNIIKYSGDNTGRYAKNSEYIDIKINQLPSEVEWVVNEAHIYSGKSNFAAYKGKAFAGMMSMTSATNSKWVPTDLTNSIVLGSKAKTAYLQAYHVPSNTVIFLDVSHGSSNVSNADEIVKFKPYLDKLAVVNTEVNWDIIKQGHVLELAATKVVEDAKDADVLFGENTISEEVENLL
jgi:stress response protein SCP2